MSEQFNLVIDFVIPLLDTLSQLRLQSVNRFLRKSVFVTNIDRRLMSRVTDKVLLNIKWCKLQELRLTLNSSCRISDEGLKYLNLTTLIIPSNKSVTDLRHMSNLLILDISGCHIKKKNIKNLNLKELYGEQLLH